MTNEGTSRTTFSLSDLSYPVEEMGIHLVIAKQKVPITDRHYTLGPHHPSGEAEQQEQQQQHKKYIQ